VEDKQVARAVTHEVGNKHVRDGEDRDGVRTPTIMLLCSQTAGGLVDCAEKKDAVNFLHRDKTGMTRTYNIINTNG